MIHSTNVTKLIIFHILNYIIIIPAESDSKEVEQADGGSEEDNKGEAADEDSSVEILTEEPATGDSAEVAEEPSVEVADEPYVDEAEVISEDSKESAEDVQGDAEDSSSSSSSDSSKEEEGDEEADQGDNNASAEDTQTDDGELKLILFYGTLRYYKNCVKIMLTIESSIKNLKYFVVILNIDIFKSLPKIIMDCIFSTLFF